MTMSSHYTRYNTLYEGWLQDPANRESFAALSQQHAKVLGAIAARAPPGTQVDVFQPNSFSPPVDPKSKKYLARLLKLFSTKIKDGSAFDKCSAIATELGVEWKEGPLKKEGRVMEKVLLQGGRFDSIRDYARGCFLVDRLGDISKVVQRLETGTEYVVLRCKNRFGTRDAHESSGYRDYQMIVMIPGGWLLEIQIIP